MFDSKFLFKVLVGLVLFYQNYMPETLVSVIDYNHIKNGFSDKHIFCFRIKLHSFNNSDTQNCLSELPKLVISSAQCSGIIVPILPQFVLAGGIAHFSLFGF